MIRLSSSVSGTTTVAPSARSRALTSASWPRATMARSGIERARGGDQPLRGGRAVERDHQRRRPIGGDAAQDPRIAAVAVEHLAPLARRLRHPAQVLLEDHERDAGLLEHLGDRPPDAAVAGDDHVAPQAAARRAVSARPRRRADRPASRSPRRTRNGVAAIDREMTRSAVVCSCAPMTPMPAAAAEQHEAELAALGQQQRGAQRRRRCRARTGGTAAKITRPLSRISASTRPAISRPALDQERRDRSTCRPR